MRCRLAYPDTDLAMIELLGMDYFIDMMNCMSETQLSRNSERSSPNYTGV